MRISRNSPSNADRAVTRQLVSISAQLLRSGVLTNPVLDSLASVVTVCRETALPGTAVDECRLSVSAATRLNPMALTILTSSSFRFGFANEEDDTKLENEARQNAVV